MINDTSQIVQSQNTVDCNASVDNHGYYTNSLPQNDPTYATKLVSKVSPQLNLIGRDAVKIQLETYGFEIGGEFYAKSQNTKGKYTVYRCKNLGNGDFEATRLIPLKNRYDETAMNDKENIEWALHGDRFPDGYKRLTNEVVALHHQIFILPGHQTGTESEDNQGHDTAFLDIDDRTIDQQWALLRYLAENWGLTPTLVVYSGGKSLHIYFKLSRRVFGEEWQEIQRKLIVGFKSDKQIRNLNREMRFAGFIRRKTEKHQEVQYYDPDAVLTPEFINERLDSYIGLPHGLSKARYDKLTNSKSVNLSEEEILKIKSMAEESLTKTTAKIKGQASGVTRSVNSVSLPGIFPGVEVFLSKEDQELLASDISEGGRNVTVFGLTGKLYSLAATLDELGIEYNNNIEELIVDFSERCDLPPEEYNGILSRASDKEHQCWDVPDDYFHKKLSRWQRQNGIKPPVEIRTVECLGLTDIEIPLVYFLNDSQQKNVEDKNEDKLYSVALGLYKAKLFSDEFSINHGKSFEEVLTDAFDLSEDKISDIAGWCEGKIDGLTTADSDFYLNKFRAKLNDDAIQIIDDYLRFCYREKCRDAAKFKLTRTPDVLVDGYFPDIKIEDLPMGIIVLKGGCGTGKSTTIARWCKRIADSSMSILQVGHRNSLLENTSKKFGLRHHEAAKKRQELNSCDKLAITDVSLAALLKVQEPVDVLILDEVEQVLESICYSGTLSGELRRRAFQKLIYLVKNAKYVIIADADISDVTLDFLEAIRNDGKSAYIVQSSFKPNIGQTITITDNREYYLENVDKGFKEDKCYLACEYLADAKTYAETYSEHDLLVFHGDNSSDQTIKSQIKNIDKVYLTKPHLIATSTLATGVDLSSVHYTKRFGDFTGNTLTASHQYQLLSRYRPPSETLVYLPDKPKSLDIDPDKMYRDLINNLVDESKLFKTIEDLHVLGVETSFDGTLNPADELVLRYIFTVKARRNASLANPQKALIDRLEDAGYTVQLHSIPKPVDKVPEPFLQAHRETKKEVKNADIIAVVNAKVIDDAVLAELKGEFEGEELQSQIDIATEDRYAELKQKKGNLTYVEKNSLTHLTIKNRLGSVTEDIVKLCNSYNFVEATMILHCLVGGEYGGYVEQDFMRNSIVSDRKNLLSVRQLLIDVGLCDFIKKYSSAEKTYSKVTADVIELASKAREYSGKLNSLDILKVSKKKKNGEYVQQDVSIVNSLLKFVGIKTDGKQVKENGETFRNYWFDQDHLAIVNNVLAHRSQNAPKTLKQTLDEWNNNCKPVDFNAEQTEDNLVVNDSSHPTADDEPLFDPDEKVEIEPAVFVGEPAPDVFVGVSPTVEPVYYHQLNLLKMIAEGATAGIESLSQLQR